MRAKWFQMLALIGIFSMVAATVSAQPMHGVSDTASELSAGSPGDVSQAAAGIDSNPAAGTVLGETAEATDPAIYIVMFDEPPVASYTGGIPGLAPTNPRSIGAVKLDANSSASLAYANYLGSRHEAFLVAAEESLGRSLTVLYDYRHAYNGLAVNLTPGEAAAVAGMPGVRQVQKEFLRYPQTDVGPTWIDAPGIWDGSATGGLPGTEGEGVVVGIIDTGLNLDHPSFAEVGPIDSYTHVNPLGSGVFLGLCQSNPGTYVCNDKLIGYYIYTGETGDDTDGHGTHTGSTAVGNHVTATLTITATNPYTYTPVISGVAPHANIIGYDGCTDGAGCGLSGLVAAINQAVADGVDVINYSIGGGSSNPWTDPDALAFLAATDAGVVPVTSAGNSGPGAGTVGSPGDAPWLLTVGASTHNRADFSILQDMTGGSSPPADMTGLALSAGYGPAPIVYAGDYGDALCQLPFTAGTWTNGEIVVCDRGAVARVTKGVNVAAGGGGGMILANTTAGQSVNADPHFLPAVHLNSADGDALRTWLSSGTGLMATISGTALDFSAANGDIMGGFSSRGPLTNNAADVIKPDVTAPGVSILAAFRSGTGPVNNPEPWMSEYNYISGTSMSSPHAAGVAALLRALHPSWSPAEVKSAMMSTASTIGVVKEDGTSPADPFDMGGGRIDLSAAGRTGLVLDETTLNFQNANPSLGGQPNTLNLASLGDADCQGSCSWTRMVSNTLEITTTWQVLTTQPVSMTLVVSPTTFTLGPYGYQVLTIDAGVTGLPIDEWAFAEVRLVEAGGGSIINVYLPFIGKITTTLQRTGFTGGTAAVSMAALVSGSSLPDVRLPVAVKPTTPFR